MNKVEKKLHEAYFKNFVLTELKSYVLYYKYSNQEDRRSLKRLLYLNWQLTEKGKDLIWTIIVNGGL